MGVCSRFLTDMMLVHRPGKFVKAIHARLLCEWGGYFEGLERRQRTFKFSFLCLEFHFWTADEMLRRAASAIDKVVRSAREE